MKQPSAPRKDASFGLAITLGLLLANHLPAAPMEVWVDDGYAGLTNGTRVDWPYTGTGPLVIGTNAFAAVQAAVNAVALDGTVKVAAGTYPEHQIVITRPMRVSGAGAAQSTIDGGAANLPHPGTVRITPATGNVTFEGFTVENAGADPAGVRVCLYAGSAVAGSTLRVSRNTLRGRGNPDDKHDYGLYAEGGQDHLVFETNTVTATGANAVLIKRHTGPIDIRHNTLDAGVWGNTAVGVLTHDHTHVTSAQRVVGNTIDLGTGGPFDRAHGCSGILFAGASTGTPGRFTDVQITDNTIRRVTAYRRGISLENHAPAGQGADGEINGAVIADNTISDTTQTMFENVGIRLAGQLRDTRIRGNTVARYLMPAVEQVDWNGHGAMRTEVGPNNQVHYNVGGVVVRAGTAAVRNNALGENTTAISVRGAATKVLVESNEFSGTYGPGIWVEYGARVDAGDCLNRNTTGLGSSAGGNRLLGYGFDDMAPHAIENRNYASVGQPTVLAHNNEFGSTVTDNIEDLLFDDTDFSGFSPVEFSQAGGLLISCPPSTTVHGLAGLPAAATNLAQFLSQDGRATCSSALVSVNDAPLTPGPSEGTITRTYTLTDPCNHTATCTQTIMVREAEVPDLCLGAGATNLHGLIDDFAGPEPSAPSPDLLAFLAGASRKHFDDAVSHTSFVDSFTDLPPDITGAVLRINLKAGAGLPEDDRIHLLFVGPGSVPKPERWVRGLGFHGAVAGLLDSVWSLGLQGELVLDLARLPGESGPATDLIPALRQHRGLDLWVEDCTLVDYAILETTTCRCQEDVQVVAEPTACGATVPFALPAFRAENGSGTTARCTPPPGSFFELGTTLVRCQAENHAGLRDLCGFSVTVESHPTDQPLFSICRQSHTNSLVLLSWPATCAGYVLEQTDDLSPSPVWEPVVDPVVVRDGRCQVTRAATPHSRFYRLRRL